MVSEQRCEYNAFTFDGVDDYITASITTGSGAWAHSVAAWVKIDPNTRGKQFHSSVQNLHLVNRVGIRFETVSNLTKLADSVVFFQQ